MPMSVWLDVPLQCGVIKVGAGCCRGRVPRGIVFKIRLARHSHSQRTLDVSIKGHGINDATYELKQLNESLTICISKLKSDEWIPKARGRHLCDSLRSLCFLAGKNSSQYSL